MSKHDKRKRLKKRFDHWIKILAPEVEPLLKKKGPGKNDAASVETDLSAGATWLSVNKDYDEARLERIALHEALHPLMEPLTTLAETYYNAEYIAGIEHAIINKLITAILDDGRGTKK